MKQIEYIKKQEEKIEELIEEKYGKEYIPDGIVNIEKYLNAQYKILWILKEPHDKGGQDGWDMRNLLRDARYEDSLNPDMVSTFTNIIYSCYGILNDFMNWDDMDYINDDYSMIDILKSIALININKLPAGATSKDKEIQEAFNKHKDIIHKQIEVYNPDIIIGGNTIANYMSEYFDLINQKLIDKIKFLEYYPSQKRVLIDAWHPANMIKGLTQEKYCDGIINASKDWKKSFNK